VERNLEYVLIFLSLECLIGILSLMEREKLDGKKKSPGILQHNQNLHTVAAFRLSRGFEA